MISNNNPGNIRRVKGKPWIGEIVPSPWVDGFVVFDTLENGYRALIKLLQTYISKYGLNTIPEIITRWAPPKENNTAAYISTVVAYTGIDSSTKIGPSDAARLTMIAQAISEVEHTGRLTSDDLSALNAASGQIFTGTPPPNVNTAGIDGVLIIIILLGLLATMRN